VEIDNTCAEASQPVSGRVVQNAGSVTADAIHKLNGRFWIFMFMLTEQALSNEGIGKLI
jgi:hypothetical protein